VCADHREPVAEGHNDARVDAGERLREHDVCGYRREAAASVVVVPVDPEQVQGVRVVRPHALESGTNLAGDPGGVGELRKRGEPDASLPKPRDRVVVDGRVDEVALKFKWLHGVLLCMSWLPGTLKADEKTGSSVARRPARPA
jgi:hypothetical protein